MTRSSRPLALLLLVACLLVPVAVAAKTVRVSQADLEAGLRSYPAVARALERLDAGEFAAARDLLLAAGDEKFEPGDKERARFLLGYACVRAEDWLCAATILDGLADLVPVVADRVNLLRGTALAGLGRHDEAVLLLGRVQRTSQVGTQALLALGRSYDALGRPEEAARAYSDAVSAGRRDPETIGLLGAALASSRQTDEAIRVVRKAYFASASSGRTMFRRFLEGLGVKLDATDDETLTHAQALLDAHASEDAVKAVGPVLLSKDRKARCTAHVIRGGALTKLRRHGEAYDDFRKVLDECGNLVDRPSVLFKGVRAAIRSSRDAQAETWRLTLRKESPRSSLNDDLLVNFARMALKSGNRKRAEALLESSLKDYPDGDMASEAAWLLAWGAYRSSEWDRALERMRKSAAQFADDVGIAARFAYWQGRVLQRKGKAAEAIDAYRACIREYPMTFYAFLSLYRLAAATKVPVADTLRATLQGMDRGPEPFLTLDDGLLAGDGEAARALWLLRAGLPSLAVQEAAGMPDGGGADAWLAALVLDASGSYTRSHRLAARLLKSGERFWPGPDTAAYWKLAYPRPWPDIVRDAAAESQGVDEALVYGVMREESAFVSGVESRANAMGLMQLILPTAKAMAAKRNLTATPETLRKPEVNVRLGSTFLQELMRRFGEPLLAIPGYNAGGGAISKWLSGNPGVPLDEFVEEIGAEETREYARKVYGSYAAYSLLYGKNADRFPVVRFDYRPTSGKAATPAPAPAKKPAPPNVPKKKGVKAIVPKPRVKRGR